MKPQNLPWPPPADISQAIRNRPLIAQSSIRCSRLLAVVLSGLLGLAPTVLSATQHPMPASATPPADPGTALTILSPVTGQPTNGSQVTVQLSIGNYFKSDSLQVYLNGADVSSRFSMSNCSGNACEWQAEITMKEGLIVGENNLRASAAGDDDRIGLDRVYFDYGGQAAGLGQNKPQYLPPAIGIQLTPGGGVPWVKVSTGTPASLKDNIDRTEYSTPYPSVSFPSGNQSCGNMPPLQVAVLNRRQPTELISFECFWDSQELKSFLMTSPKVTEATIVVVGTTARHTAPPRLDTSSIGGTDYSNVSADLYPQTYAMIGVKGMKAGSEYESYNIMREYPTEAGEDQLVYAARATGLLVKGDGPNFDFHPSNNQSFSTAPDPNKPGASLITIGTKSYTALPQYSNGLWLIVLNRLLLRPVDYNNSRDVCPWDKSNAVHCGTFYPTGSTDTTTASNAIRDLTNVLNGVTPRQVAILTSVGQPLRNTSVLTDNFASVIIRLGGSRFTLPQLTKQGATYTLMAPGATADKRNPFSREVVTSSSVYTQQSETGYVVGIFARNQKGLYGPLSSAQVDGKQNGDTANVVTPDQSFDVIVTQPVSDWPLTDTSGHIAAYHFASQWFLTNNNMSTGSHSQDLRYFYPGNPILAEHNKDFNCALSSFCPRYPGSGFGFTQQDLDDANNALYKELTAMRNAYEYLDTPGLGGLFGQSNNSIALSVIQATHNVVPGEFTTANNTPVSQSVVDFTNLIANSVGIVGTAFNAIAIPEIAGTLGVMSGVMREGSAMANVFKDGASPPSYESKFDTTLGNLSEYASKYAANMVDSYAIALDTIYSDSGKLQAVQQKISDTDSGWLIDSHISKVALGKAISAGASRALYLQLMPQFYALDYYPAQPINSIGKLGIFRREAHAEGTYTVYCDAAYPSNLNKDAFSIFHQIQGTKDDIFVIGGPFFNQGKNNVSESFPTASLLNTLFNSNSQLNLNFVKDYFYSNTRENGGILQYRGGPDKGNNARNGNCYKIGCSQSSAGSLNPYNTCKGP